MINVKVLNRNTNEVIRNYTMMYNDAKDAVEFLKEEGARLVFEDLVEEGYIYYARLDYGNETHIFAEIEG